MQIARALLVLAMILSLCRHAVNGQEPRLDAAGDPLPEAALARLGTVRLRCGSHVIFSPDGKMVASWWGRQVGIFDLATGKEKARLTWKDYRVLQQAAFSRDGKRLALSFESGKFIEIWDLGRKEVIWSATIKPDLATIGMNKLDLAFSEDETVLLSSTHWTIHRWDAASGKALSSFTFRSGGKKLEANNVVFSSDARLVATACSTDDTVRLWDAARGKLLTQFAGHPNWHLGGKGYNSGRFVATLAFAAQDRILLTGDYKEGVRLWDVKSGRLLRTLAGPGDWLRCLALAPDGETIVAAASVWNWHGERPKESLRFWNLEKGKESPEIVAMPEADSVTFSADGKLLAYTTGHAAVRIIDWKTRKVLHSWPGHEGTVYAVAFSPDGGLLASAGGDHDLRLWSTKTFKPLHVFPRAPGPLSVLAYSPNGKQLVCGGWNDLVVHLDHGERKIVLPETRHARSIAFAPKGKLFAMASSYAEPWLWKVDGNKFTAGKEPNFGYPVYPQVSQVTFSADGQWMAFGGESDIVVRELAGGKTLHRFPHRDRLQALAMSPDKKRLVGLYNNGSTVLWNVEKGRIDREFRDQPLYGYGSACFSPDSKLLAFTFTGMYGKRDRSLQLWDLTTFKELGPLTGHREEAACVAFSPAGKLLASGSLDTTILVWDVERLRKKGRQ
jgi:WD40 repeat protein